MGSILDADGVSNFRADPHSSKLEVILGRLPLVANSSIWAWTHPKHTHQ